MPIFTVITTQRSVKIEAASYEALPGAFKLAPGEQVKEVVLKHADAMIDGVPADAYEANHLECAIEQVRSLMRAGVNRETAESRVARDFCLDQWLIGINIDRQDAERGGE